MARFARCFCFCCALIGEVGWHRSIIKAAFRVASSSPPRWVMCEE
ncbi:hypothetical protein SynROS8604_00141 [Synechococcus sp. ROS8604]|nr:hypothetical protein SynROS8604_00141 [Synechococcus sp. ROS8604]